MIHTGYQHVGAHACSSRMTYTDLGHQGEGPLQVQEDGSLNSSTCGVGWSGLWGDHTSSFVHWVPSPARHSGWCPRP